MPCLGSFGVLGLFVVLSLLLLIRRPLAREARELSVALSLLLGVILLSYLGILIFYFLSTPVPRFTPLPGLLIIIGFMAFLFLRWDKAKRRIFAEVMIFASALFLAVLAIAIGDDFQNQHFLAATPFYAALTLSLLQVFSASEKELLPQWMLPSFVIVAALINFSGYPYSTLSLRSYPLHSAKTREGRLLAKESALRLDAILDHCKIDRYYILKNAAVRNNFEGFTKHTPANFFFFAGVETIDQYHEELTKREMEHFFASQIIVAPVEPHAPVNAWEKDIAAYVEKEFSEKPWPCAEGLPTIAHRTLLYRILP